MPAYYSSIPTLENLKQNDVILYNPTSNVNFQTPQIQELFKQGAIQGYQDPLHPEKGDVGVKMVKPYVNQNTLTNLSNPIGSNAYSAAQSAVTSNGNPTANMDYNQIWNYLNNDGSTTNPSTGGMTIDQARATYGTNFTGVTQGADGLYYNTGGAQTLEQQQAGVAGTTDLNTRLTNESAAREAQLRTEAAAAKTRVEQQVAQAEQEARDVGGRSMGAMRRILAKGGGISGTAAATALVTQDNVVSGNIAKLEDKKTQLMSEIESNLSRGIATNNEQLTNALISLQKEQNDLKQQQFDNFLNYVQLQNQEKQSAAQLDISTLNALSDIPEGQSVTIGGNTYTGLKKPTVDTQLVKNELTGDSQLINMDTGAVISTVKGTGATIEQNMVLDMASKYEDAGILPTDTLASATAKLKGSKIYQDKVRGPVGNGKTDEPVTFQSAMEDTAKYLNNLRDSGKLTDLSYKQAVSAFMSDFEIPNDSYGDVSSQINNLMSGKPVSTGTSLNLNSLMKNPAKSNVTFNLKQALKKKTGTSIFEPEEEIGSDFIISKK